MSTWTILTAEYPPDKGGVADYTAQIAAALAAAGDRVIVVRPPADGAQSSHLAVELVALPDRYGRRSRRELGRMLDGLGSSCRVLVQYVPAAFGCRGMNLPWCLWLLKRSRHSGDEVRIMFHEPYFYFGWDRPHRNALAVVQRLMAAILLRAARQVYFSTNAWQDYLARYAPARSAAPMTLAIPSAVPACDYRVDASPLRDRFDVPPNTRLVGHFGTYGAHIAPMLSAALIPLLKGQQNVSVLCIGTHSDEFVRALTAADPDLAQRVRATGWLPAADVALHIAACDLMLQPYPDGVTTRRTSVMACLVNGRAVVTTSGRLTEAVWTRTGAVALAPADAPAAIVELVRLLVSDDASRAALALRGEAIYRSCFSLERTIAALRDEVEGAAA